MNNFWKIIRYAIVFLLFLELYFWIGSGITQVSQFWGNAWESKKKSVYRIVCVGESMTMVGGKDSYPSQLEVILNNSGKNIKFQVINQGMGGANTTTILRHLPQWLDTYKPDMVIAMIGALDPSEGMNEKKGSSSILKQIKLYRLFKTLGPKIAQGFEDSINKQKQRFFHTPPKKETQTFEDWYQLLQVAMRNQPDRQKELYILIDIAKAQKRYDIAEKLYEQYLQNNTNDMINIWVIKEYGNLLVDMGDYDKFVQLMPYIPYNSWKMGWVKGYCHGEDHLERVRQTIEAMVHLKGVDTMVYANVASCYEEGGRRDLAAEYFNKLGSKSSYYYPETRANYLTIKDMLLTHGVQPVFVQYPMRDVGPLLSIFEDNIDKSKIIFIDNGSSFREAVLQKSYNYYFVDRMFGDVGHATPEGNHLLASHIATAILKKISP